MGTTEKYIATRTFALGSSGQQVVEGTEIEFDGTNVIYGGQRVAMPQFRGALRVGWARPVGAPDAGPQLPPVAGMQIRPADGGNPMQPKPRQAIDTQTVEAEEREVGTVEAHTAHTTRQNATNYRRDPHHPSVVVEEQDGTPVRTLKTAAGEASKHQRTTLTSTSAHQAIQEAGNVSIEPGQGVSREEMLQRMNPQERARYEAEIAARRAQYVESTAEEVRQVQSAQAVQSEGIKAPVTTGGGIETVDMGGTGATPARQEVIESEGIRFGTTNGPQKDVQRVPQQSHSQVRQAAQAPSNGGGDAIARQIARSVCPDFPDNYDFGATLRKKIARLQADYDDRHDIIRAVAAADVDPEVRAALLEEFPGAFA
jgi:hypothetical protein